MAEVSTASDLAFIPSRSLPCQKPKITQPRPVLAPSTFPRYISKFTANPSPATPIHQRGEPQCFSGKDIGFDG